MWQLLVVFLISKWKNLVFKTRSFNSTLNALLIIAQLSQIASLFPKSHLGVIWHHRNTQLNKINIIYYINIVNLALKC